MEPMDNGKLAITEDLVIRTLEGDRDAFTELVTIYRDAACAVAYTYFGSFDDVQDAVQEAFVHSYIHLGQLNEPAKFGPWLRRITANTCLTRLRKRKKEPVSLEETGEQSLPSVDSEKNTVQFVVHNALRSLSEDMRLTVTLSYINGYSHTEVAQFLDVPLETVRSRLKHAKRKLREEMIGMVEDVLHEEKPGVELIKQILDMAELVHKAMMVGAHDEALQRCDDALAALGKLSSSKNPEQIKTLLLNTIEAHGYFKDAKHNAKELERLKGQSIENIQLRGEVEIRLTKGDVLLRTDDLDGAKAFFHKAIELAESHDYPELRSEAIERIAHSYHNNHQSELARQYLSQAIEANRAVGNSYNEAMNLWGLANSYLDDGLIEEAKPLYERACVIFQELGRIERSTMTHAVLKLIGEVGEERFSKLIRRRAFCQLARKNDGIIQMADGGGGWQAKLSEGPWALDVLTLWLIDTISKEMIEKSVPPGRSWAKEGHYYIPGAVKEVITVVSYEDRVSVPAGTFADCLLLEMVTTEDRLPDNMSEAMKQWARSFVCGTRRAWFAPGLGLVQFTAHNNTGDKAVIQLTNYEIIQPSSDYLPFAVGNSWTYGWVNLPEEYVAKDVYRVAANDGELWYLENYSYAYKK